LSDLFKQYLYVGRMIEAVADWIDNHNVENISAIQEEILGNYKATHRTCCLEESNCQHLISEDMQHGQKITNLVIRNIFN